MVLGAPGGDDLGSAISGVMDIEGDGQSELAMSAPGKDDTGTNHGAAHLMPSCRAQPRNLLSVVVRSCDDDDDADDGGGDDEVSGSRSPCKRSDLGFASADERPAA